MKTKSAVYVGEIGDIVVATPLTPINDDVDTDSMTHRQLFDLLLRHGLDVRFMLGIDKCYEHYNMTYLGGLEMPAGYSLLENCRYCRNCWAWFREKHL